MAKIPPGRDHHPYGFVAYLPEVGADLLAKLEVLDKAALAHTQAEGNLRALERAMEDYVYRYWSEREISLAQIAARRAGDK